MTELSAVVYQTLIALQEVDGPAVVSVIGPSGSGKTTVAASVASLWSGTVISLGHALSAIASGHPPTSDCLLVADGLDRVSPGRADVTLTMLERFSEAKVLVTTERPLVRRHIVATFRLEGRPSGTVLLAGLTGRDSTREQFAIGELSSGDLALELIFAPPNADNLELRTRTSLLGPNGEPLGENDALTAAHYSRVAEVSDQFLRWLSDDPTRLRTLDSRKFEEVVAELLARQGYEVQVTPAKRDGGRDIHVAHHTQLGQFLYFVECKQWNKPVHVDVVRSLHGVVQAEGATAGIVATTSRFTKGAYAFKESVGWRMSLKDLDALGQWLTVA